ncbi:hypothetical protein ACFQV2_03465 [Actinokineospora soli]|uniref:Uncharacterized protein n=1 Tax=Actinokineospora soli TaxID=1048753 RepID=A0ABW2TGI8_9PSEU
MSFAFASRTGPDVLVVVGADALATEVLDALSGAAQGTGKRLVLVFGRITDDAAGVMGYAGADCAVFLRLPNHRDAQQAADYLGKHFTFVVNGFSISEGRTDQWSESRTRSTSSTTGTSQTWGSSSSVGLNGALSAGRNFGNTVSDSFTSGSSDTTGHGGSTQATWSSTAGRVHEHVVPPETFQRLDDGLMLVVRDRTVVLAVCDHTIASSRSASAVPWGG